MDLPCQAENQTHEPPSHEMHLNELDLFEWGSRTDPVKYLSVQVFTYECDWMRNTDITLNPAILNLIHVLMGACWTRIVIIQDRADNCPQSMHRVSVVTGEPVWPDGVEQEHRFYQRVQWSVYCQLLLNYRCVCVSCWVEAEIVALANSKYKCGSFSHHPW